jgi:tripartite-type tricarboxylate transporter receptor subunit TctC
MQRRPLLGIVLTFLLGQPSFAQDYPNARRDVRHIIPWGAGGATDAAMRGFMLYFEKHLGVQVVTENIPGGLSAVGLIHVKTAPPDGYTIGTVTYDVLTLELQGLAPVSWKDFEPLGMVTDHPSALMVSADRWRTLEEFRVAASAGPGSIKVGNVGTGGVWHQHAAAMEKALEVKVSHVPYEAGSGAQLAALLGGEVDANVTSLPAALPYVKDGTLRVLAVMSGERDDLVPDVPTFKELGFDIVYGSFRVVVAPKATPPSILNHLEKKLRDTWNDPEFQAWAQKAAIGARWRGRDDTRAYLEDLAARVRQLMDELGLR